MNVVEAGLEGFVQHMGIVVLKLLGSLNRYKVIKAAS